MQNQSNSNTSNSLSKAVEQIVKESIKASLYRNAVDEKDKQNKMLGEEDEAAGDESKKSNPDDTGPQPTQSKTVEDEKQKLKKGDVETKDIIDKLNFIRSGKSFKDEAIEKSLDEYVKSLSKAERVALLAFLKGLSQIVTGEVQPDVATDPADPDPDVKMKKGSGPEKKKTIKPNVIKAPDVEKKEKPSSEDTSGPVPITPKKK